MSEPDTSHQRRVSLVMMARNAESTILRTLQNVQEYVSELVLIDNLCTDKTVQIARDWAALINKTRAFDLEVYPADEVSHPDFFVRDTKDVFTKAPFCNQVGYSELPLLIDWAALRNLAVSRANCPYVMMLDADDVFVNPELIPTMVALMEKNNRDVLHTTYQLMRPGVSFPVCELICWRIFERKSLHAKGVRWVGATHEQVVGYQRTGFAPNLILRDMRDNKGDGARVEARALKILWLESERLGLDKVSARDLYYLGSEAMKVDTETASFYLKLCIEKTWNPDEKSSAYVILSEIAERHEKYDDALEFLKKASGVLRTPDVCFAEGRILFVKSDNLEGVQIAIPPLVEGLDLLATVKRRLTTRNPAYERGSYILLVQAYAMLGKRTETRSWALRGLEVFPGTAFLENHARDSWELHMAPQPNPIQPKPAT